MLRLNLLVLLLIKSIQCMGDRNISSVYKKLRDDIFKDYDRNARPAVYNTNVTIIRVEMHLTSTFEINEQAQTIDVDSYMVMQWNDDHLKWDYRNYEGISSIQVSGNEIWMPDIYEIQRGGPASDIRQSDFSFILLRHVGIVRWFVATALPGRCEFDYDNYPNDVVRCTVMFEIWSLKIDAVDFADTLIFEYGKMENFPKPVNSQWKLIDVVADKKTWRNVYPIVYVTFILTRKTPILQEQLLWIGSVIIVLLTLGMFWIPADIEQKMTVGCVMMMIMTAVLLTVSSSVGAQKPVILIAGTINNLMFVSTAAIILEIIAINLQHIQEWKPPEFLLNIFSGTVGRILLISSAQKEMISTDKVKLSEDENDEAMMEKLVRTGNWKTISQAFDRVAFLVYIIVLSTIPKTP